MLLLLPPFFPYLSNRPISLVTPCAVDIRQIRRPQWRVCGCTYPSPFPARREIKIHRRCIFPRGDRRDTRGAGERIGNGWQRQRGKSGEARRGREGKSDAILSRISRSSQKLLCLLYRFQRELCTSSSKVLLAAK